MTKTVIATLRTNLKTAIETVFKDASVLDTIGGKAPVILEGKTPKAWFLMNLAGGEGVVFSYEGNPLRARGPLGRRDKDRLFFRFSIALCSGNWADPVGATYMAADLSECLKGTSSLPPETPNLRQMLIANIGGDDIYVRFVGETSEMAPNSTVQGWRVAILQTWETYPEVPM